MKLFGQVRENLAVSVEFYAGKGGVQDGEKLEDVVPITADRHEMHSLYSYEQQLL